MHLFLTVIQSFECHTLFIFFCYFLVFLLTIVSTFLKKVESNDISNSGSLVEKDKREREREVEENLINKFKGNCSFLAYNSK